MKAFRVSLFLLCLSLLSALAQSPGGLLATGNEQFSGGDFEAAAKTYEQLIKDYPTSAEVYAAYLQLAFAQYYLQQWDAAIASLGKATTGAASAEIKGLAAGLLPQVLSGKAGAMPLSDPKRKTTFEDAIKKYTEYLNTNPDPGDTESARYGRAFASYQIGKYDEAIKDLEANVSQFKNSPTIQDSENLLAVALATEASRVAAESPTPDLAKVAPLYRRATDILRGIIERRTDLTLVNSANFQLGEILLNQAAISPADQKAALYEQSLVAFRNVEPKEKLVAMQRARLQEFPALRRAALQANDQNRLKQLDKMQRREADKLAALEARPDQTSTAMVKMAEIYFNQERYDAARVVLNHILPLLKDADNQKRGLYFKTMTYALQGAEERAVASYGDFQGNYKGDPLASNLPAVLGTMFLSPPNGATPQPEKAVQYFQESLTIYPKGPFAGLSIVNKATAETQLGKLDEALKTFQDFLKTNPPAEEAVGAQLGVAGIYKDTGKLDDAIAAYRVVLDKYKTFNPQVTEAEFFIAALTQQKGDNAAALPLLQDFIKNHPDSPLVPGAMYSLAQAQLPSDQNAAMATLADLAARYPESPASPISYFLRAQVFSQQQKPDEVDKLMREFAEKYPQHENVYYAYDAIAQNALQRNDPPAAIAAYSEFVSKLPENPAAPQALLRIAELRRTLAERMGRFGALTPNEQEAWKKLMEESLSATEQLLKQYPDSLEAALGARALVASQKFLADAQIKSPEEVQAYFRDLAEATNSPVSKNRVLFALGSYLSPTASEAAGAQWQEAYDAAIVYAPADMDAYGTMLLEQGKTAEAKSLYEKLAKDFPNPPNVPQQQIPLPIQEAQAMSLFGLGKVAQASGNVAEAGKLFEQLKQLYPWSPKVLEADLGIALSKRKSAPDEALSMLSPIVRSPNAPVEVRAQAMLLMGFIFKDRMEAATEPKAKDEAMKSAIDLFIKTDLNEGAPRFASEGLWEGGQLLEMQAAGATDPAVKNRALANARRAYEDLIKKYPDSPFVDQAKERLGALPAQ